MLRTMGEELEYCGYRLMLVRRGGWHVLIYPPRSNLALSDIPNSRDPADREKVVAEAKAIVDRDLAAK